MPRSAEGLCLIIIFSLDGLYNLPAQYVLNEIVLQQACLMPGPQKVPDSDDIAKQTDLSTVFFFSARARAEKPFVDGISFDYNLSIIKRGPLIHIDNQTILQSVFSFVSPTNRKIM